MGDVESTSPFGSPHPVDILATSPSRPTTRPSTKYGWLPIAHMQWFICVNGWWMLACYPIVYMCQWRVDASLLPRPSRTMYKRKIRKAYQLCDVMIMYCVTVSPMVCRNGGRHVIITSWKWQVFLIVSCTLKSCEDLGIRLGGLSFCCVWRFCWEGGEWMESWPKKARVTPHVSV